MAAAAAAAEGESGESEEAAVEGRNWKSERRRSAHLLAEKLLGRLLGPPLTALSLWGFLVVVVVVLGGGCGGSGGRKRGLEMPMLKYLSASIGVTSVALSVSC